MFFPRRKLRIFLTWILLAALLQILIYAVLFVDVSNVPRTISRSKNRHLVQASQLQRPERPGITLQLKDIGSLGMDLDRAQAIPDSRTLNFAKDSLNAMSTSAPELKKTAQVLMTGEINDLLTTAIKKTGPMSTLAEPDFKNVLTLEDGRPTGPSDVFLAIKTTRNYHQSRMQVLMKTWISLAKEQVYVFSDGDDPDLNKLLGGHLVNTKCESSHHRAALCCKMQAELNYFWEKSNERWFCHFDDDNYVNFPALIKLLREHNHTYPHYIGKPSINHKIQGYDREKNYKMVSFWFATGGAGLCLSRVLVARMAEYFRNHAFVQTCDRIGLPDDCVLGYIAEYALGVKLKKSNLFHSHLEGLRFIRQEELRDQVTFSHGYMGSFYNRLKISGPFSEATDPSRYVVGGSVFVLSDQGRTEHFVACITCAKVGVGW